ncbi:hypothetical protein [Endozoicomonas arenosclerae]|uniref:hypothetical protein n=1 Tax=Endozoicomonas arenosclerae TaxID=1633495 RepID=UPI0007855F9C|nr:hypothetical protein [Endozoicomonas arenosclerae]
MGTEAHQDTETSAEEMQLQTIEAMAGEGDDYSPDLDQEADEQARSEADAAAARQGAVMALSLVETVVKMRWSFIDIADEQKEAVIEKAVPVMQKYGADLPEFLKPYREEIELGMVVAATGFGVFMQVKAYEAAQEQAREEKPVDGEEVQA